MFKFFKKKLFATTYLDHHYSTDAGHDIYSTSDALKIAPYASAHLKTELHIALPKGTVGLVMPRSSVSAKGLHVYPIVVDAGFAGEIQIFCHNLTNKPFFINKFDRIAQLVILPCIVPQVILADQKEVETRNAKLSERGFYGYGSTGK